MVDLINKWLQIAVAVTLFITVLLIWRISPKMAIALAAMGSIVVVLSYLAQRKQKKLSEAIKAPTDMNQAKLIVTSMLAELTKCQVKYLQLDFDNEKDAKSWLKKHLPRSYKNLLDQVYKDLESSKKEEAYDTVELAHRLIQMRQDKLDPLDNALLNAQKEYNDYIISSPLSFVETEHIGLEEQGDKPQIYTVAAWNPLKKSLVPTVDYLTVIAEDKKKKVLGQISFKDFEKLSSVKKIDKSPLYTSDITPIDKLSPDPIPLGFLIGEADTR